MQLLQKLIPVSVCFIVFISCAQNKQRPIDQLYKNTKQLEYPSMPQYYIEGYQSGCYYEILVNDMLVFKHFKYVGLANHSTPINDMILKSGLQKITIKLYPLGEIDNKNYTTIDPDDTFRLKIFMRDQKKTYKAFEYDFLKEHEVKIKTSVPYFEETITFNAEVPYQLDGWSNSKNLTEMDQDQLEKEILLFYKNYGIILNDRDEKQWAKTVSKRERERVHSVDYNNKKSIEKRINEYKHSFDNEVLEVPELDNYKISFFGNGRVVTLRSLDRQGESAFHTIEQEEDNEGKYKVRFFRYLLLHKPKGSNTLEIIR